MEPRDRVVFFEKHDLGLHDVGVAGERLVEQSPERGLPPVDLGLGELDVLLELYRTSLARFQKEEGDARKLIQIGESRPPEDVDAIQLAAWTMVANLILNLDETVTKG